MHTIMLKRCLGRACIAVWLLVSGVWHLPLDTTYGAGPATVTQGPQETSLATVTLTPKAKERLGIATVPVLEQSFRAWRSYPGTVVAAWNRQGITIEPAPVDAWTSEIFMTLADRQVVAEGDVKAAGVEATYAERRLERVSAQLKAKAAKLTDLDDAERLLARARSQLATAEHRRRLLGPSVLGQNPTLWVSVPVYAGEVSRIDRKTQAELYPLGAKSEDPAQALTPIGLNPVGHARHATVTLLYHLPQNSPYLPGQRARVRLPLDEEVISKSLPWSAVLHDIFGGQWVYVELSEGRYERRRIQVRAVREGIALLDQGPETGTPVVTDGAPELFGTEFGVGH